jgi:hypothetical protein
MKRMKQTRKPNLSLWQSAIDQVVNSTSSAGAQSVEGGAAAGLRDAIESDTVRSVADFVEAVENLHDLPDPEKPEETAAKGIADAVYYCSGLALKIAGGLVAGIVSRNTEAVKRYRAELARKMGDCDPTYAQALLLYAQFKAGGGVIPYRRHTEPGDFVMTDLPPLATIAVVGDWGTGQEDALALLKKVRGHNPDIVVHLGDIYYSGTQFEVDNYFYGPWSRILKGVRSFSLSGNHDMYSGGAPYYSMIDKLGQPASYFCVRNDHWQIIGIDTGLHSNDGGPTRLEDSEKEWLRDRIANFGGQTILMSHHQLFSANEEIEDNQSLNLSLYKAVDGLWDKIALWLWGHEHDLVIFGEHVNLKRGRCVGCGAFPVGVDEPKKRRFPEVPVLDDVQLSKNGAFWALGYAILKLNADGSVTATYYQDVDPGKLFEEQIPA